MKGSPVCLQDLRVLARVPQLRAAAASEEDVERCPSTAGFRSARRLHPVGAGGTLVLIRTS